GVLGPRSALCCSLLDRVPTVAERRHPPGNHFRRLSIAANRTAIRSRHGTAATFTGCHPFYSAGADREDRGLSAACKRACFRDYCMFHRQPALLLVCGRTG